MLRIKNGFQLPLIIPENYFKNIVFFTQKQKVIQIQILQLKERKKILYRNMRRIVK
jgi:hypothetical protein